MSRLRAVRPGRLLAAVGAAAVGLAAGAGCGRRGDSADESEHVQPVVGARTALATAQPFTETVAAIGTVAARVGHVAALSAPGPARVARVFVSAGQHVARGAPLVELEQAPFAAAAQSADAALTAAEQSYERARRLSEAGIVPRKELDQAAAELAQARASAVTARRAQQLSVLRAPIGGVVTRMGATLGSSVDASQPLVEVADPSALDIVLNVTPTDAARVRSGAAVTLGAGQNAAGEPLGVGTVADVAGTVDSASRSVAVRVRAPATRRPLRIGETVFGQIAAATRPSAITVPLEALVPEGEGFKVFVVDAAGTAHARPVTVGGRTDKVAEITSGLAAGERPSTACASATFSGLRALRSSDPSAATRTTAACAAPAIVTAYCTARFVRGL
jgi:cobalt-zinc-cadmium efflux system membrane fusion protein